jgi:hypothetical protein
MEPKQNHQAIVIQLGGYYILYVCIESEDVITVGPDCRALVSAAGEGSVEYSLMNTRNTGCEAGLNHR